MRRADLDRLRVPYPDHARRHPATALGIDVREWEHLEQEIVDDLVEAPPYGVGWWNPHPGTSRRILISDQLYCCAASVLDNIAEAAIHMLEYSDYAEQESDRFRNAVTRIRTDFRIEAPRRETPLDDLGPQLARMHLVGVARAVAGTLDCLAGTIIGITAIPLSILKADLHGIRALLRRALIGRPLPEGEEAQVSFGLNLEAAIEGSGPHGWLEWAIALRNMLIHRGRRLEIGQFVPREPMIYGPDASPVLQARSVTQLPRDPGRSDVEVFLDPHNAPVLTENAEDTLAGLLASTRRLVNAMAPELLQFWRWRRANPTALSQPTVQWPHGASTATVGFEGYAPGTFNYSPTQMTTHPLVVHRMRAAALDDSARGRWTSFD